ncbi:hypothetical protein P3710_23820 [Vibrio parahaemolyticus]|nr:hypothetical protein [Vibrio parahaemolyticus]MDF4355250.1 hypothetical protein [Vibrio parahaemolyticus]MDF5311796.1 hypothetical protein [Vibrio parahaemolyticus]MDF5462045.1 hypothetical protein [Vibrio parahaemolyticus]
MLKCHAVTIGIACFTP